MSDQLIITHKRGLGWYCGWSLVGLSLLVGSFYLGRFDSREERLSLQSERDTLLMQVAEDAERIAELEQQNIMLQSSAQVDAEASQQIMDTINSLQQHIDALEKELSFYRGIMAPELDIKGLHVSDFTLKALSEPRKFVFQLALTQVKQHDQFLKGDVSMIVKGTLNGKATQYSITELSNLQPKDLTFAFKYFQHIGGEIELPEGFKPKQVEIVAAARGRNGQRVEKSFPWSV
jgi:predicted RNase H-like nuclease (RuvC/YqgF family)